jgi:glycosyltransferase involved in cell wall biosynthesis
MPEHGNLHVLPPYSVVIPCYNHGEFLDEAVDSALNQTHPPAEIIVVDDGSTDTQTLEVFGHLKARGITVLHKQNGHLSSARNYGIGTAAHAFILVLDADDRFHPAFAEKALPLLLSDVKNGAAICAYHLFGAREEDAFPSGGGVENFLLENNGCASMMLRKAMWEDAGGYDESMKTGFEDWEFWIRCTSKNWNIAALPEILFDYRVKNESMYLDAYRRFDEIFAYICNKHEHVYKKHAVFVTKELMRRNRLLLDQLKRERQIKLKAIDDLYNRPGTALRALAGHLKRKLQVR